MTDVVEAIEAEAIEPDPAPRLVSPRRAIAAATVGNMLEFYDFVTYAFFAIQIGNTFFPTGNAYTSLMASLATFGAGFITRPIGAFVLGGYADRAGRKPAMLLSMTLMGFGIAALALTPGYAQIGMVAPVIAICARLLQGFALGGEIGSATTYMLEAAAIERRGFMISWQTASQGIAATLGAGVGFLLTLVLTEAELSAFGWRIALLVGASIVPFALVIRRGLPETIDAPEPFGFASERVRDYWRVIVLGFFIIGSGTIGAYVFNYMATYGQANLHLSAGASLAAEAANNLSGAVTGMIGGYLSDRHGRRMLMLWPQLVFMLLIVPCFLWITEVRDPTSFILANIVLAGVTGFIWGPVYAALSESLPKPIRARVFALVYSVPVAVLGGTTQLVVTWLLHVTGSNMSIAYYLTAVTGLGVISIWLLPESAPIKLRARAQ